MTSSIQLLRSTSAQERPFAGNLLEGQPAANLHSSEPGLFFKTTDGSIVKFGPAAITSDGSPPNSTPQGSAGNSVGELWLDKSLNPAVLKVYDGAQWVDAGSGSGGGSGSVTRWVYTSTGGETSLSGESNGVLLNYTPGLEEVFINGALLVPQLDYSATNGSSITDLQPLTAGDVITVTSIVPLSIVQQPGLVSLLRWITTATALQTVLSGIDTAGNVLEYTAGLEEVYINGVLLRRDYDYTADGGSTIILASPLSENDEIAVLAWSPFTVADTISASNVSFTQDGTGAVSRSVQNKLRDLVSVKDFGAVGDGITDDTAKLQAALDSGKPLDFGGPENVYIIKSTNNLSPILLLNSSRPVVLHGTGATIKIADDSDEYSYILSYSSNTLQFDYVSIRGLQFDGNKSNMTYTVNTVTNSLTYRCDGIKIINAGLIYYKDLTVKNIVCANFLVSPSVLSGSYTVTDFIVEDCKFENIGDSSLPLYDCSIIYTNVKNSYIRGNIGLAASMGENGARTFIELHSESVEVKDNHIWGFENGILITGITLEPTSGIISGNNVNVTRNGIWLLGGAYQSHTSGYALENIIVCSNKIKVRQSSIRSSVSATSGGIIGYCGDNLNAKGISVSQNLVEFEEESTDLGYFAHLIGIGFPQAGSNNEFEALSVCDNTVINAPTAAYVCGFGGGVFTDFNLENNTAINPGQTKWAGLPSTSVKVALYAQPTRVEGYFKCKSLSVSDKFTSARLKYAFFFNVGSTSVTTADISLDGSVTISGTATQFVTTGYLSNANVTPLVHFSTTKIGLTSTPGNYSPGSTLFDSVNKARYGLFGDGSTFQKLREIFISSSAPSSGSHSQGDIVFLESPTSGGFIGYVCTVGGSPGTWKTFGAISP